MKVAILGGTFNPVHLGHLCLADDVRLTFGYESIVFVPANIPAHKNIEEDVSVDQRIDMLRTAVKAIPHFTVDTCEIDRGGISYTIDTVRLLSAKYSVENKIRPDNRRRSIGRIFEVERSRSLVWVDNIDSSAPILYCEKAVPLSSSVH